MANTAFEHSPTITVPGSGNSTDNAVVLWNGTTGNNFSNSLVIINSGAVTGVTTLAASTSLKTPLIEYTDGDDAITIADGGGITVAQNAIFTGTVRTPSVLLSGSSNILTLDVAAVTAAYTIILPDAVPGATGKILQTSGSDPWSTLVWADAATIVPTTIAVLDTTDSTTFVGLWTDAAGDLAPKTDAALTYNASNGALTAVTFHGSGANLTNLPGGARSVAGDTDNGLMTWVTSDNTFAAESTLTYNGTELAITGTSYNQCSLQIGNVAADRHLHISDAGAEVAMTLENDAQKFKIGVYDFGTGDDQLFIHAHQGSVDALKISGTGNVTIPVGNLVIGTAGKGIDFAIQASPGAGMASELLDRYEEGTWTPRFEDSTHGDRSQTFSQQIGRYTRIGNTVWFQFRMTLIFRASTLP